MAYIVKPTNGEEIHFLKHEQLAEACGDSIDSFYIEMGKQTVLRPSMRLLHGTTPLGQEVYCVEVVLENLDSGARTVGAVLDADVAAVLEKLGRFDCTDLLIPEVADERLSDADNEGLLLCRAQDRFEQLRREAERLELVPVA